MTIPTPVFDHGVRIRMTFLSPLPRPSLSHWSAVGWTSCLGRTFDANIHEVPKKTSWSQCISSHRPPQQSDTDWGDGFERHPRLRHSWAPWSGSQSLKPGPSRWARWAPLNHGVGGQPWERWADWAASPVAGRSKAAAVDGCQACCSQPGWRSPAIFERPGGGSLVPHHSWRGQILRHTVLGMSFEPWTNGTS